MFLIRTSLINSTKISSIDISYISTFHSQAVTWAGVWSRDRTSSGADTRGILLPFQRQRKLATSGKLQKGPWWRCFFIRWVHSRPLNLESYDAWSIHFCLGFSGKQNGLIPDEENVRKVNSFISLLPSSLHVWLMQNTEIKWIFYFFLRNTNNLFLIILMVDF